MRLKLQILVAIILFSLSQTKAFAFKDETIIIAINTAEKTDEFDGIGAVSAGASSRLLIDYPEPYRSQILDYLFKPNYGAALQHLKVEIGGDINSTDGSQPSHMRTRDDENYHRGYEWWLMKEAKKRNPDIILSALPWGAPAWIGNGEYYSQDMADYIVKFVKGAKEYHDLDIKYVGGWNEKQFDGEWLKLYRQTLDKAGLNDVMIVASDMNGPPHKMWEIADSMVVDQELKNAVYAIGVHYAHAETFQSAMQLREEGKKLWSSEEGEWNWYTMLPYPNMRASKLNINYIDRFLTKTLFWSPVTSYYDCLPAPGSGHLHANTPWSGAYQVYPKLWEVAHTTQFAQPGWYYIRNASRHLPAGGSLVTLTDPDEKNVSVIIETTQAHSSQKIIIKPEGENKFTTLHLWYTDDLNTFRKGDDLVAVDGEIHFEAKPRTIYSLTTTTGQHRGEAVGANPAPFPLPYKETFDSYPVGATPRYLSDQYGAYEVESYKGRNKVLAQQILKRGIEWAGGQYTFSILGDMHWTNMDVSADVSFEKVKQTPKENIFASVIARNFQGAVWAAFTTTNPIGYSLILYADGRWTLVTDFDTLAEGKVELGNKKWHNIRISCHNNTITGWINGKKVSEVKDTRYRNGLAGIGSSFDSVLFDNLKIREP
jgi:hypothetical protein